MEYTVKKIDENQIINLMKLFESVYHKNSPFMLGLVERFKTSDFGLGYVGYMAYPKKAVYKDGVELPAAYYGVFPQIGVFKNNKILCAQSGDTMTHPHHRGRGLFVKLAKLTRAYAEENGIEFIYGFPSPQSYPGFHKKLDWVFPFKMVEFLRIIPALPLGLIRRKFNLEIGGLDNFGIILNKLGFERCESNFWSQLNDGEKNILLNNQSENKIRILRDENYLNYKMAYYQNKWIIRSGKTAMIIKYDGDINIGEVFGEYDPGSIKSILRKIDLMALLTGTNRVRSFFSPGSKDIDIFSQYGLIKEAMPFGYLNLSNKYNINEMRLNFIDYDYF